MNRKLYEVLFWVMLAIGLCLFVMGCAINPETGQAVITPDAVDAIDTAASIAEPAGATANALALWWPPASIIGGLLVGAAGAWRRMKPQLTKAESEAELAKLAGEATSAAIEQFKASNPETWATLSKYLRDNHGVSVENFYRGLRGLPPKD